MKCSVKETVWQSVVIIAGSGGESHIQCTEVPEQRHRVRIKQKTIKDQLERTLTLWNYYKSQLRVKYM